MKTFHPDVSQTNWDRIVSRLIGINMLVDDCSHLFTMIINKHAPINSMRVSKKCCLWINKDIRRLIRERGKLKKKRLNTIPLPLWSPTEKLE